MRGYGDKRHGVQPAQEQVGRGRESMSTNKRGRLARVLAGIITIPLMACLLGALTLQALGLRVGQASAFYAGPTDMRPVPTLLPDGREALPGTTITIWFLDGPRFFPADTTFAREMSRGQTEDGKLAYYIAFDEAGFNRYLTYWFLPPGDELNQSLEGLRDPRVDLTPGGLVLNADVNVGGVWKRAGLVYTLDENAPQLHFIGIEFDGQLIGAVPGSFLDDRVGKALERVANRALRELTFIDGTGAHLTINRIAIDEDQAVVLATEQ